MTDWTATNYFTALSDSMQRIEVSDGDGRRLPLNDGATRMVTLLDAMRDHRRKILILGNGGSAAIAGHIHNDLSKAVGLRALVFTDVPLLTALTNDNGYASAFEWSVTRWAEPGDALLAISSSGKSENILRAARAAIARGCTVVTFSGFMPDNPLRAIGELNFYVPSMSYGPVEMVHAALAHFVTDAAMALQASRPAIVGFHD